MSVDNIETQPDTEQGNAVNELTAAVRRSRAIASEGDSTPSGTRKVLPQWGNFGGRRTRTSSLNFWPSTPAGNQIAVTGGYWIVQGSSSTAVAADTLTLTGTPAYVCVRKTIAGTPNPAFVIINDRSVVGTDATYHYIVLCKCVLSAGVYSITERNHPGGDIVEASPLP
jgi:hypothetical protein